MNRRKFFKGLFGLAGAAVLPAIAIGTNKTRTLTDCPEGYRAVRHDKQYDRRCPNCHKNTMQADAVEHFTDYSPRKTHFSHAISHIFYCNSCHKGFSYSWKPSQNPKKIYPIKAK